MMLTMNLSTEFVVDSWSTGVIIYGMLTNVRSASDLELNARLAC